MKKYLLSFALLLGVASIAHADLNSFFGGDDKLYHLHFTTTTASLVTSTNTILIDLSDTANYPHKETGEIDIAEVYITVDRPAVSTGSVKIGVVNTVNSSTGSVVWFRDFMLEKSTSSAYVREVNRTPPTVYRLRVNSNGLASEGSTPYLFSTDKTIASTLYQNDVPLNTSAATAVTPAQGDIIIQWNKEPTNPWNIDVELFYNSKPR